MSVLAEPTMSQRVFGRWSNVAFSFDNTRRSIDVLGAGRDDV